ncbi:MAG: glycosyltransferase family 2 protein [bacterium]
MKNLTLSVIMPALNEEKNIELAVNSTICALKKYNINGEIIVINDGSTDNTKIIVENLCQNNNPVKLINHENPKGIGYSFWDGVKNSTKDIVVMFPGDNENDPEDALTFFHLMQDVDIIIPFIHNIEVRERKRRIISSIYRFIINISFGISLNYTNGTVFYRRLILNDIELKNFGFFYQAELLIKLIRKGYLFAEVPNYLSIRNTGKSKAVTLKSLMKVMKGYLNLAYEIHIKRIEGERRNYIDLNKESASYIRRNDFEERMKNLGKGILNV